jgi:ArsR family transcriptional regulator
VWDAVSAAHRSDNQFAEDDARLAAVIAARRTDSRSFFGRKYAEWDGLRDRLYGRDFWLPTLLSLLPGEQVVADLGCGTGEALELLGPVAGRVIGVDREPAMLAAAAVRCEGHGNIDLRAGGLEDLPLVDGEVDIALAMLVLHHVLDLDAVFRELRRVMRPGARVILLDMMAHNRVDWAESMGHVHLGFSRDQLQQLAATAGLRMLNWTSVAPSAQAEGPPLFVAVVSR